MAKHLRQITSKRQLALELGRPESTIRRWLADSRFPFRRRPPWPASIVRDILRWARSTLDPFATGAHATMREQSDGAGNELLNRARLRKILIECRRLDQQIAILDDRFIDRERARAAIAGVFHNTATALLAEADSVARMFDAQALLRKGAKDKAASVLRERLEALCNGFADGSIDLTTPPPDGPEIPS